MQVRSRVSLSALVVGALLSAVGAVAVAQSADALAGTWKLDVAKSKYSPGPAPKDITLRYEAAGAGLKVTVDADAPAGKMTWGYTAGFDGKESPVTGNPEADMVSQKRIDAATTQATFQKGGKTATVNTRVVSADGKTLTITSKGTNAEGKAVENVQVFVKQ